MSNGERMVGAGFPSPDARWSLAAPAKFALSPGHILVRKRSAGAFLTAKRCEE